MHRNTGNGDTTVWDVIRGIPESKYAPQPCGKHRVGATVWPLIMRSRRERETIEHAQRHADWEAEQRILSDLDRMWDMVEELQIGWVALHEQLNHLWLNRPQHELEGATA